MSDKKEDKGISELLKKVVSTGVGAAFMTEEAIKTALNEVSLPKDIVTGLVQNAKHTKEEFVTSIKSEFKKYLSNIDVSKELEKILDKYEIEVEAKLNFKKKEEDVADADAPKKKTTKKKA